MKKTRTPRLKKSDYKELYENLLKDYDNLKIRQRVCLTENKALKLKLQLPLIQKRDNDINRLKSIINQYFNVDLDTKIRKNDFVLARVIYYNILVKTTNMSYARMVKTLDIGQDRTTVYNSRKNHEDWYQMDKNYRKDFDAILNEYMNHEQREASNN